MPKKELMVTCKEIDFGSANYENAVDHHLCALNPDGKLVACLIMTPVDGQEVKMRQFAVDQAYQQRGIGKGLVGFAEKWALERGFLKIALHARETAVPFYLHLDYAVEGDLFMEVTLPHRYMYKCLENI
jgi:GNAT superfamily N-acetyltransferase